MTYKDALTKAMDDLAKDPLVRFVGYGVRRGRAMGTLKNVPDRMIVETSLAENLMTGLAIGMSLKGLRPVVFFERFDFVTNAMDALVNHLDKMGRLSNGEFMPAIIVRVVVGNRTKPLFTGLPHTQNLTKAMEHLVNFPVQDLPDTLSVQPAYECAHAMLTGERPISTMLVEYKDLI